LTGLTPVGSAFFYFEGKEGLKMWQVKTLKRLLKTKEIIQKSQNMMTEATKQRELNNIESAIYYLQEEIREKQRKNKVNSAEDEIKNRGD